ncbi:MAG: tetratricopeptide repeat protein [Chloroflexota bacterium]
MAVQRARIYQHMRAMASFLHQQVVALSTMRMSDALQEQILALLDHALKHPEPWPQIRLLMLSLAAKIEQRGLEVRWIRPLGDAVELCKKLADAEAQSALSLILGLTYQSNSQWDPAEIYYQQSAEAARATGNVQAEALALSRLAYLHRVNENIPQAESLAHSALRLLPEGDCSREFAYFVLGTTAADRQDTDKAERYFRRSLVLCQLRSDEFSIAKRKRDLGVLLTDATKYREARVCLEEALAFFERLDFALECAQVKESLGVIYRRLQQPKTALDYYADALRTFLQIQSKHQLAQIYNNQGYCYRLIDRWSEAEAAFIASANLWEEVDMPVSQINALDNLGEVYLHLWEKTLAINTFRQAASNLPKIRNHPRYCRLREMVYEHLEEAERLDETGE